MKTKQIFAVALAAVVSAATLGAARTAHACGPYGDVSAKKDPAGDALVMRAQVTSVAAGKTATVAVDLTGPSLHGATVVHLYALTVDVARDARLAKVRALVARGKWPTVWLVRDARGAAWRVSSVEAN